MASHISSTQSASHALKQCGVPPHCFKACEADCVDDIWLAMSPYGFGRDARNYPRDAGATKIKKRRGLLHAARVIQNDYRRTAKISGALCGISWAQGWLIGASGTRSLGVTMLFASIQASTSSPLMSGSIWPLISTHGLNIWPLFSIISWRCNGSLMTSRSSNGRSYLRSTARTPWLQPQVGFK